MRVVPFTAGSKETLPEGACVLVTTYAMMAKSKGRSEEGGSIMEEIYGRHWGLLLMDEVLILPCAGGRSHTAAVLMFLFLCAGSCSAVVLMAGPPDHLRPPRPRPPTPAPRFTWPPPRPSAQS
jgi:hypothetical protein